MNSDQNFEPDPTFIDRLERQLAYELKRPPVSRRTRIRTYGPMLATILLSILAGYGASLAAMHYRDSSDQELLLAEAGAAVELAQARLGLAETHLGELRKEMSAGQADPTSLAVSDLELSQMRRELERARLDHQEIEVSGNPVRNQLSSPLVGGRDFVSERLRLELDARRDRVRMIRVALQQAEHEVATGIGDDRHLRQMQHEMSMLENEERDVEYQLDLRASYLAGRRSAQEVTALTRLSQARARLEGAKTKRVMAETNAEVARRSFSVGTLPPLELKHAEFEVIASGVEERLARLEVEHLERKLQEWTKQRGR